MIVKYGGKLLKIIEKERNEQVDLLNSSNYGAMRLFRKISGKLGISCRDLSDVRTGTPPRSLYGKEEPETLQKTSRGVLCRIRKESMIKI
jgi:hypothetical protein